MTKKQLEFLTFLVGQKKGWLPPPDGIWPFWLSHQTVLSLRRKGYITDITGSYCLTKKGREVLANT